MKTSRVFSWGLVVLVVAALAACSSPSSSASGGSGGSSSAPAKSLVITIGDNINARDIAPALSMTAVSYTVSGVGPSTTFGPTTVTAGTATISNLETGSWTVTVNAYNGDTTPTLIGKGTAGATVSSAASTPVSISVLPVSGNGTLNLTVTWPAAQISGTPSIQATLSPAFSSPISPSAWTVNSGTGTGTYLSTANSVPTGYSTLVLNLLDSAGSKAWVVDTVRIIDQQTTSGTYALSNLNQAGGALVVNVTTNLQNPLTLSLAGTTSPYLANGSSETLTVTVVDSLGNPVTGTVTYLWYVDGVVKQTSASNSYSYTGNRGSYSNYSASIAVVAYTPSGSYGSVNVYQKVQ